MVFHRGARTRVLDESRALPVGMGIARVSASPCGWTRLGARRRLVSRRRNFSNWAYWRVQLDEVVASDPCPLTATSTEFDAWRVRPRARLVDALGPAPADRVPLDMEVTESVDCGDYQRDRIVFDTDTTMAALALLLVHV